MQDKHLVIVFQIAIFHFSWVVSTHLAEYCTEISPAPPRMTIFWTPSIIQNKVLPPRLGQALCCSLGDELYVASNNVNANLNLT